MLSQEHEELRKALREFAEEVVAPKAAEIDQTHEFPQDTIKKMAELGYLGIPIPEEYGGAGMDFLSYVLAVEELARVCGSTAITLAAHTSLCTLPIMVFGTEEQKRKHLPPLARGEMLGAFALTEPEAGSDAGATKTKAVLDGDHYTVNGQKVFCTNGEIAGVVIFTAMTDPEAGTRGISSFIIEKDTPGFTYGPKEKKMGLRAAITSPLYFEDCRVPKENLLGQEGKGFKQFLITLDSGRIVIGAMALGLAQGAMEQAVKYSKERKQFGQAIAEFQGVQWMLAEMSAQIQAARQSVYYACELKEAGKPFTLEAASAKYFASQVAMDVTRDAIQVHGGYGYTEDFPVERMMRDAKLCEIGEGTNEVCRMVIARNMLRE